MNVTQYSLWDEPQPTTLVAPPPVESTETREAYERRRVLEMAEKLQWRSMRLEGIRQWPGVTVASGEAIWRVFLAEATDNVVGLMLLALCALLNPLYPGCIDGQTGLWGVPVESSSRVEERYRARMMQLAEVLEWPRISYWDAGRTLVFGPGQDMWQKYNVYGSFAAVGEAITVLERRMRGEPDKTKLNAKQIVQDDDED